MNSAEQGAQKVRGNCNNCAHLEWVDGESERDSGYTCNKRHEKMWALGLEDVLVANLERDEYRAKGKHCFEPDDAEPQS